MRTEEIAIPAGDVTLAGTFTIPGDGGPYPAALILAGSGPLDRDGNARRLHLNVSRDLALMLASHGWASVRYDKRGVGASTGDYVSAGFFDELADAEAALRWLVARPGVSVVAPVGHSAGAGFAAELAAQHGDSLGGAVLLAATAKTGEATLIWQAGQIAPTLPALARGLLRLLRTDVLRQQRKALERIKATSTDVARIQGAKLNARWMREFIAYDPVPTMSRIAVPVLAMTGSKDTQVDPDDIRAIASLLPSARAVVLPDVDHILRHEPRPVSDVRRYKKQARQPIDPSVSELLVEWLHRLDDPSGGAGDSRPYSVGHVREQERFDAEAATWDDDAGHEQRQVAVARAIGQVLELNPRMRALDVGGGTGRLSILLADRVGSAVVTDPSAGMVRVARERIEQAGLSDRLRAVRADLTTEQLEGSYDVAWSSLAVHHVPDLDGLLRSLAGLLVDGGRLAIADLDEDPDGAFHADVADFDGHHGFDRDRLAERLVEAGFASVQFVDATTIRKGAREFGVFLCTATKGAPAGRDS